MSETQTLSSSTWRLASVTDSIKVTQEHGVTVLSPAGGRKLRRIVYINSYGGQDTWEAIQKGICPTHHLWGCVELVGMGYEVALPRFLPDFYFNRRALPHDLRLLKLIRSWLGRDGIVFCGHNVLYWVPFLRRLGFIRCHVVSLLFAREPLRQSGGHTGIIGLNPAATDHARKMAPQAKVAHLGWGADLTLYPKLPYDPEWFLSCGMTQRDHPTLSKAAGLCDSSFRVISVHRLPNLTWPSNVEVVTGGRQDVWVDYRELLHSYYGKCSGSLTILKADPDEFTGVGMTNVIEAMAMARPVIVTRTGALPGEIDVEKSGCGLFVPAGDAGALAEAVKALASSASRAREMGEAGRRLVEKHYNMERFSKDLHAFFESLG
jgi:hypothetical protein